MSHYFPKQYEPFRDVKVDLSNYVRKADLKNATGIDMFNLALKSNLAKIKADIDKINIDKLQPVLLT